MSIHNENSGKINDNIDAGYPDKSPLLHAWLKRQHRLDELDGNPSNTYTLSPEVAAIVKKISILEKCSETSIIESIILAYAEAAKLIDKGDTDHSLTG
ncbi:MAG TPA: hypothetical protein VKA08_07945 [Balneolales bacterium]|jgi:hypothetical protein|nr:hypothetical protein [Balneolales bacterium]